MERFEEVLSFWFTDCSPSDWYKSTPELDADIKHRFEALWHDALSGRLKGWCTSPRGTLAVLVLTDQFPRNMFRGSAQAFASDPFARAVAKRTIDRGFDLKIDPPARQFFYLPLEHSECLYDQERAVRLITTRLEGVEAVLHARVHREIIRRFGRFPFRNAALGRTSTKAEQTFLEAGGYGEIVREFQKELV